jgi:hypothetical protein
MDLAQAEEPVKAQMENAFAMQDFLEIHVKVGNAD